MPVVLLFAATNCALRAYRTVLAKTFSMNPSFTSLSITLLSMTLAVSVSASTPLTGSNSKTGHMDLIVRQGKEVGLSADDVMNAAPLPTTTAAMYAWFWIARTRPWQEAIAASTLAEWTNDDRLLGDIGGGNCSRLYKIWSRDLNFSAAQVPNFTAHSKADVKHSDMFIDVLEKYVAPGREQDVLTTATDSMDIHRVYFGGMAQAMERAS